MMHGNAALAALVLLIAGGGFAAGWTARGAAHPELALPAPERDRSAEPAPDVAPAQAPPSPGAPAASPPAVEPVRPARPTAPEPAVDPAPTLPASPPPSQEQLLAARGFSAGAALDLQQRSERLKRAREYLSGQAQREESAASLELARAQRREIGDDAYSDMLWSAGIPNRIVVDEVLPDSNASRLGLQRGDVVLRYDGERLFEMDELRFLVREPAELPQAEIELVRDGKVVRLSAPRGILGVTVRPSFDPPREDLQPRRSSSRRRAEPPRESSR